MADNGVGELARRHIAAAAERALERAGVLGVLPTPLQAVTEAAGIREVVDVSELPEEVGRKKPSAWRRLLGAILFRERTVFVDLSQMEARARFTEAHEVAHRIIPWHEGVYYLDEEETLFRETRETLELEANAGAAELLFQGRRFHERALHDKVSIHTPIALSDEYGTSCHATIRYYVEGHPDALGLIVAGQHPRYDGTVPILASFESPLFGQRYGHLSDLVPSRGLNVGRGTPSRVGRVARNALQVGSMDSVEIALKDLDGERQIFKADAFFNQRTIFVMLAERRATRLGRRVRVQAG